MPLPPPPAVETVVVTGARLPTPAGDPAFSVVTVNPARLAEGRILDQALRSVPSFSLFRRTSTFGANPTTQGVSLRAIAGSGASRALVTLDGVPQNDPFGGWVIWTALPPSEIGGAKIVRGAGAGPYGAGALTGVVALDGRDSVPGGIAAELSGGSRGERRAEAAASTAVRDIRALLAVVDQQSDGWIPVREGRGAADRPLTLRAFSVAGRVEADLGPATLTARLAAYREARGSGLVGANARAKGAQASVTLVRPPGPEALGWRLQGWVMQSALANSTASASADRSVATPAGNQYDTPALGAGLNAALRRTRAHTSVEFGADLRWAQGETRELVTYTAGRFTRGRVAGGQALLAGLYGEASWRPAPWLLTGGVRLDRWADDDAHRLETTLATGATTLNLHPADQDGVVPTARVGLRRALGEGGDFVRGAAYSGFRPATLNELHRPFRVGANVTEADPALEPERLYGVEAGAGRDRGPLTWSATVFYNRLGDAITNVTVGRGPGTFPVAGFVPAGGVLRMRQNAGAVDAYGLEAEAERRFGERLSVQAGVAYTHSRVDGGATAPQLTGLRPALTPRWTATAQADWRATDRLRLSVTARYESARFDDDLNTLKLGTALTTDARAEWRLNPRLTLFVAADNLFDAAVQTAESADGVYSYDAPRTLRIGVRLAE